MDAPPSAGIAFKLYLTGQIVAANRPFRSLTLIVSVKAVTPTAARRLAGREYIRDFLTVGERASDSVTLRC